MQLKDITLELSVQANLDGQDIKVITNGEDSGVKAKHIFKKLWFETGKITGYSILEFYSVKDGFLVDKEGNQTHFSTERFPEIKINRIKIPFFFTDIDVSKEWVRDTGKLMNLEKTEETVKLLSPEDKKALQDEREVIYAEIETKKKEQEEAEAKAKAEEDERLAEEARKAEEEAKTAAEKKAAEEATRKAEEEAEKSEKERIKAEKEAEEAKAAEEDARIQAEKSAAEAKKAEEEERLRKEKEAEQYTLSERQYSDIVKKYNKLGVKQYVKGKYRFFYHENIAREDQPFVLAKRGDKYEELEGGIVDENEEEVEFEFTEEDKDKRLTLIIGTEDIIIE